MQKNYIFRFAAATCAVVLLAACGQSRPAIPAEVVLHTTAGDIRIELDNRTPQHRDNFLKLVREGFYDSLLFHRVIPDFMIQSGDPDSRHAPAGSMLGEGGPGYEIPSEIIYPALAHTRGALAAARTSDEVNPLRNSSGSQFFIVWGRQVTDNALKFMEERIKDVTGTAVEIPDSLRALYKTLGGSPHLDGQYTVFGRVVEGLEVVGAIDSVATDSFSRPLEDVRILRAEVVRDLETARK